MPILRGIVCWAMIVVLPTVLLAADSGGAILYGKGTVWLNNSPLPRSSAIFPGDVIRTERDSGANFNALGASVVIQSDSIVKFEGKLVSLEHGSVSVATSSGMAVRAMEVTVAPESNTWTEFEVTDVDGTVRIVARQGELNIQCGKDSVSLPEGQQATREESGKCRRRKAGAYPPTSGAILTNRYMLIGTGVVAICIFWICLPSSQPPIPPISPWQP